MVNLDWWKPQTRIVSEHKNFKTKNHVGILPEPVSALISTFEIVLSAQVMHSNPMADTIRLKFFMLVRWFRWLPPHKFREIDPNEITLIIL